MKDGRWTQRVEMVAAVSVVITLFLLMLEVRGNTRALERQILLDRASSVAVPFMEGPELLEAFKKVKAVDGWGVLDSAFMERYSLEPAESVAWIFFLYKVWSGLEADYIYLGPSDEIAGTISGLLAFLDNQLYWDHAHGGFTPEFVAYVESVASTPAAGVEEDED